MAIASIRKPAGATARNFFTDATINMLVYEQSSQPTFSPDNRSVTYTLNSEFLTLTSLSGLDLFTFAGTISGVSTPDVVVTGLQFTYRDFAIAVGNGDLAAMNALVWSGNDTIRGGASNDELRGFGGDDNINGGAGNDSLFGDEGADVLFGSTGNDLLSGGSGDDRLDGGTGDDRMLGGTGNDRIAGGQGLDNVFGGEGADTFVFTALTDFAPFNASLGVPFDIIRDFRADQGDRINLQAIDANELLPGNQAFQVISGTTFSENTPGRLLVEFVSTAIYVVRLNTDNDAAAEASFIVISPPTIANPNGAAPVAADFVL